MKEEVLRVADIFQGCLMTKCYNGASCCFEQGRETLPHPAKLPINGENYQPGKLKLVVM